MEMAALLSTSSQITEAVKVLGRSRDADALKTFEEAMFGVQRRFIEFMHLFRFIGISNQIPADRDARQVAQGTRARRIVR